jgi:hypothetical protein
MQPALHPAIPRARNGNVYPSLYPQIRLRRLRIRSPPFTNLYLFPENQHTRGLCLFISWIQLDGFIKCTECLGIFPEIYQYQTLVEPRICESGVGIRCLTEYIHRIAIFIFTGHLDFLRASLKFR